MNAQGGNRFPSTHWSLLAAVRGPLSVEHRAAMDRLVERYRYPAYLHIRVRGFDRADAEDLVQEFFANWRIRNPTKYRAVLARKLRSPQFLVTAIE